MSESAGWAGSTREREERHVASARGVGRYENDSIPNIATFISYEKVARISHEC